MFQGIFISTEPLEFLEERERGENSTKSKDIVARIKQGIQKNNERNDRRQTCFCVLKFVFLDDRQITHLICVRLKHLLFDFWGGVWASFLLLFFYRRPKTPPKRVI